MKKEVDHGITANRTPCVRARGGQRFGDLAYLTNREKRLLDAAVLPNLSGGIRQLAQALQAAHYEINWKRMDEYLVPPPPWWLSDWATCLRRLRLACASYS